MSTDVRPSGFTDFVGQDKPKRVLQILCRAAAKRGACVPHVLLSGGPGLGKTTLARIVAAEMGSRLVEVVAANLQAPEQMTRHLTRLKKGDVLFIDEIHGLPRGVEEILYAALEDGCISVTQNGYDDLMKSLGMGRKDPTTVMVQLPPFTCMAATTLSGLVSDPLRSRFVQTLTLEPYGEEELQAIVLNAAVRTGFPLTKEVAGEIARRSRCTARNAIGNLRWLAEFCAGTGAQPGLAAVEEAFALKEIDRDGLTKVDRAYLFALAEAQVPVGLATIAASVGESDETLAQAVEPFLLRGGWVRKTARGRVATQKTVDLVGAATGRERA